MLQAALDAASHGWRVFPVIPANEDGSCPCIDWSDTPCEHGGKHPAVSKWPEVATTDPAKIRAWWGAQYPGHNVAIATGKESNLLVADADGEEGLKSAATLGAPDDTPRVKTGRPEGGRQLYFQCPEDLDARNFAGERPGLDARANGGYVVAVGSEHWTGNDYVWEIPPSGDLPMPPQAFVDLLKAAKARPKITTGQRIIKGMRNSALASIAGSLRRTGLSEEEILGALRVANRTRCQPPLNEDEVEKIASSIGNLAAGHPLIVPSRDDLGNAERFAAYALGKAVWVEEIQAWLAWDGRRWSRSRAAIDRLLAQAARAYQKAAADMEPAELNRAVHIAHAASLQYSRTLEPMIRWSRHHLTVSIEDFDREPYLLNVLNGTIDLLTGELRDHDPADLLTHLTEVEFKSGASSQEWDAFLKYATAKRPELHGYLQRLVRYILTGSVKEKVQPILWGRGDTGKSVFTNIVRELLGEYGQVMKEATLAAPSRQQDGNAASSDVARLRGIRLAIMSETSPEMKINAARLKAWTGRNKITARENYGHPFDFEPTHKTLIETNNRPKVEDADEALWNRIQLIMFDNVVPKEDRDDDLEFKLRDEMPGILNWAIGGCLAWQKAGLQPPASIVADTKEYREAQDTLAVFFEANCELGSGLQVPKTDLYTTYRVWAEEHDPKNMLGRNTFASRLEAQGYREGRASTKDSTRCWMGIGLKSGTYVPGEGILVT